MSHMALRTGGYDWNHDFTTYAQSDVLTNQYLSRSFGILEGFEGRCLMLDGAVRLLVGWETALESGREGL